MIGVVTFVWSLSLGALALLWFRRPHSVLDVWLMVVLCAWLFDIALSAMLNEGRFDLGFYVGRIYGLLAASFVLIVLLFQTRRAADAVGSPDWPRPASAPNRNGIEHAGAPRPGNRGTPPHLRDVAGSDPGHGYEGQFRSGQPELDGDPRLPPGGDGRPQRDRFHLSGRSRKHPQRDAARAARPADAQFRNPLRPQGRPRRLADLDGRVVRARAGVTSSWAAT